MLKIYIIIMVLFALGYGLVRWSVVPELRRYIGPRFVACYVLMVLAAAYTPTPTIYLLTCAGLFLVTVRGRLDGVCGLIMLGLLTPSVSTSLTVGGVYLIQTGTVQFLTMALAVALMWQPRGEARAPRGFTVEDAIVLTLFLILWIGVTRFPSVSGSLRSGVAVGVTILLPYLIFRRNLRTSREVSVAIACLAVAAILSAVVAVYESRTAWLPLTLLASHLNAGEYGLALLYRGNMLRPAAGTGNALMLAALLASGFVATACSRRYLRTKLIFALWLGLLLIALILEQSRGNLVVLALVCVILLALSGRMILATAIAGFSIFVYELLVALASQSPQVAAFLGIHNNVRNAFDGHYDYRGLLLDRGMEEGAKHRWFGTSMENIVANMQDMIQGQHIIDFVNTYLVIYLVSGLFGIVILVGAMATLIGKLTFLDVRRSSNLRLIRAFALVSFVAAAVELGFMSFIGDMPMMLVLTLAASRTLRLEHRKLAGRTKAVGPASPARLADAPRKSDPPADRDERLDPRLAPI